MRGPASCRQDCGTSDSPHAASARRAQCEPFARLAGAAVLLLFAGSKSPAGDWPQVLGPHRNAVALDEVAVASLADTAKLDWAVPLGQGYAGPAVVGDVALIFHRVGDQERLQAIDRATGQVRWTQDFPASYRGGVDPDQGPRSVPLVHEGRVVVFGAAGVMHVVQLDDGRPLWSRDVTGDFGGNDGYFGAGTTPLAVGDRLLINAGGRRGGGLVALDVHTGKTLWQATDEAASYASPTLVRQGDEARALFVTRMNAMLIDPNNGNVIAKFPFGRSGPTVNAATPIVFDQYAFLTASYRVGAALLRLDGDHWEKVWANDDTLSSQYNTPVYADGFLYGIHGREDQGTAELRCVHAVTGRVAWRETGFGVAHAIRAGDRLLLLKTDGTLVLAEVNAEQYRSLGRLQVSQATTRALPALSNGQLFIRENQGSGGRLLCLRL